MISRRSCVLVLALVLAAQAPALAIEVGSKRLIENAKFYDGKVITYKGEAVTAILKRGEHGWVNINDGDNAIGIWCKTPLLAPVTLLGDYNARGDTVEVVGVFNRACQDHGGELDIHADTVTVIRKGHVVRETVDTKKAQVASFLFLVTIAIVTVFRKRI